LELQRNISEIGWVTLDAAMKLAEIVACILRMGAAREGTEP
jgi:hypothetical protein